MFFKDYIPIIVKPKGGGGGGCWGEGKLRGILHFQGSESQIPYPWTVNECLITAPRVTVPVTVK